MIYSYFSEFSYYRKRVNTTDVNRIVVKNTTQSLTSKMIKEINYQILQISPETNEKSLGGVVRDSAMLDFLVDELDCIEDSFEKAAVVLQKIAIRHPFWQGNKRTAFVSANIILILAGYEIDIDGDTLNHDIREIITSNWSVPDVKKWILKYARKIKEE